jgi:hypothetical protein
MLDQQVAAARLLAEQLADFLDRRGIDLTSLRIPGRRPVAPEAGSGGWRD